MRKLKLLLGVLAFLPLAASVSTAQNVLYQGTYGVYNIRSGFTPDPITVPMASGGPNDVSLTLGSPCVGFVATAPDLDVNYQAGSLGLLPLAFFVRSDADTTLVINAPDGTWYCDDDSGIGVNPSITFSNPMTGNYDVWVGTYGDRGNYPATLHISELYDG